MVCSTLITSGNNNQNDSENRIVDGRSDTPGKKSLRRLSSTRGFKQNTKDFNDNDENIDDKDSKVLESGWVRIYGGPDPFADMKSSLLYLTNECTVKTVVKKLSMSINQTVWIQYGGGKSTRLLENECPLRLQDDFLMKIGFTNTSRRSRLGIDPELRYLIRIHGGPGCPPQNIPNAPKSAPLQVLKGLVFPNWKRRSVTLADSKLLVYPGSLDGSPEVMELGGGDVELRGPRCHRLVLRLTPPPPPPTQLVSPSQKDKHIFLGFDHYWERNLWFSWFKEATQRVPSSHRLDITSSGFKELPDECLFNEDLEEFLAGSNSLGECSLDNLRKLINLKIVDLSENKLKRFPDVLIALRSLKKLYLNGNLMKKVPASLAQLQDLEELNLSDNELCRLPEQIQQLNYLKTLDISRNRLQRLPLFLTSTEMRTLGLLDIHAAKLEGAKISNLNYNGSFNGNNLNLDEPKSLSRINLRDNQLKGSIILGNYGNLTQLDVSENNIEKLDLSALDNLEVVQCTRNNLQEIFLNGRCLMSLVADFNKIEVLHVKPTPTRLQHMDLSHNEMECLPDWIGGCHELRILFATHNKLNSLPEHLFCSELSSLHTLRLGYNKLTTLPSVPRLRIPLQELFLQSNALQNLPANFFAACDQLKSLNLSNNRLSQLPNIAEPLEIEKLYLTANCLNDNVMETMRSCHCLRILHIAYNCLTILPEYCVSSWSELEELVLSGNSIERLPDNLAGLQHLRVLRVHSNRLHTTPTFAFNSSLKVLDLAHNELDAVNLITLVPKQLQFLDLSCNLKLRVDPKQLHMCRSQRPMSLVDVSGQNRHTLPTQPWSNYESSECGIEPPWKVGFSETTGNRPQLCVTQLRLPTFCNVEGLFGMFDGGNDNEVPNILSKSIPRILLEEKAVKETANEYMKYTILSAHRELKEKGQRNGACVTICHISRIKPQQELGFAPTPRRYILRVASVGEATAILSRPAGPVRLTPQHSPQRIGHADKYPNIVPNPEIVQVILQESDEFLILANKRLWDVIDVDSAIEEVRAEKNVILAAKRLQDLAQSYGMEENISIMILKFNGPGSDVDQLMKELRQTIRKSKAANNIPPSVCQLGCCCEYQSNCCHSINQPPIPLKIHGSDRSSPSGQSDQTTEVLMKSVHPDKLLNGSLKNLNPYLGAPKLGIPRAPQAPLFIHENGMKKMGSERRSYRGVARAIRARIEEQRENDRDDTDSAVSEEQFKCWEYMLEQNTQLLFDKELNTLSKGFTRHPGTNNLKNLRNLSNSSPQLAIPTPPPQPHPPLFARQFGSARSYNPMTLRQELRFGSGRGHLNGGPHAAYFGSLQRLMPYNLEYDFAVMQERNAQDSLDQDGRMQQYWGVATTEL